MNLLDVQREFALGVAWLIQHAALIGYTPRLGEAYRTLEQAAWNAAHGTGIKNSLHTKRLAIDLILDRNGVYLVDSADYRELGEAWERYHKLARWGGRFAKPDGNHFSFEWNGVQ